MCDRTTADRANMHKFSLQSTFFGKSSMRSQVGTGYLQLTT